MISLKIQFNLILKDGWLIAENTTLGADNGIGVALALAVLESNDIAHGPIEVLLTIDEEAGMSGARLLESGVLTGQWLLILIPKNGVSCIWLRRQY
jgi:dipeptidase D